MPSLNNRLLNTVTGPPSEDVALLEYTDGSRWLGIEVGSRSPSRTPPAQVVKHSLVGSQRGSEQNTPDSGKLLFLPASTAALSGSTRCNHPFEDVDISHQSTQRLAKHSTYSFSSLKPPSVLQNSEPGLSRKSMAPSIRERYNVFFSGHICTSAKHFRRGMNNWLAMTIIMLSLFSTFYSAVFLVIALKGPKCEMIGTQGTLTVSSAAFLTSFFARMIDLSFVTVVVAFIGQSLARRAFRRGAQSGVTLAEMSMRGWISQPGTMFTHWESVRYAAPTWLGLVALISAIMALLYTSAATALVQPQLKFSGWEKRALQSPVMASFANGPYLEETCKTPITPLIDDVEDIQQTCISNEHASQAYHNYFHWIGYWTDVAFSRNATQNLSTRPTGWALLNDNTTITAPWIDQMALYQHEPEGWFIKNITMGMPHPGVALAAVDPANRIQQPDEFNGLGIYSIRASVPCQFVNVLCAMGMSGSQLKQLIWDTWNDTNSFDASICEAQLGSTAYDYPCLGGTPFDDIFLWGAVYGSYNYPPIFPTLPRDYNTIINDTTSMAYGRTSIYVLGKGGAVDAIGTPTNDNHALCQLQVSPTPDCSTR